MASVAGLEKLYRRRLEPIASKLSKGLASLPDEILAQIFKFATRHERFRTRYAGWLSQVSRRFRRIALSDRTLWSTLNLWYDTTREELERIISRSGGEIDLHAVINMNHEIRDSEVDTFICSSSHSRAQWRTLTITGDWSEDDSPVSMTSVLDELIYTHSLDLPRLEEICISECHLDGTAQESLTPFSHNDTVQMYDIPPWATRICASCDARTTYHTRHSHSSPCPSLLVVLSLNLIPGKVLGQIGNLLSFLNSTPSLTEIVLGLKNSKDANLEATTLRINPSVAVLLPSVTSFRLHVSDFRSTEDADWLLSTMKMPNLAHFALSIEFHDRNGHLIHPTTSSLRRLVRVFLPDPLIHSLVTSLVVDVSSRPQSQGDQRASELGAGNPARSNPVCVGPDIEVMRASVFFSSSTPGSKRYGPALPPGDSISFVQGRGRQVPLTDDSVFEGHRRLGYA